VLALDATQIASDFLPTTNNLFDVGSSALRWAEIYGVILNISGTSTLADVNISGTSTLTGAFVFNEDSADLDARFEGNGVSNLLKIDGGNDQVEIHGGQVHNVTTVNAATYDLLLTDYIVSVTHTTTAAVTSLTLPTAQAVTGRVVVIKDAGGNASANNITIDTQGSETIDGASTNVISTDFGAISLYTDGTNWFTF
jgi:hypothetical protein